MIICKSHFWRQALRINLWGGDEMRKNWQRIGSYVAVGLVALIVGYFIGREHVKYEIRTAFQSAAQNFQKGLAELLGGVSTSTTSQAPSPAPKPAEPAPFNVALVSKTFHNADPSSGDFESYINLSMSFANLTGKDIRAFDGVVTFTDLLDNEIMTSSLAINDPVKSGANLDWQGSIKYNQFMDAHQALRAASKENLKISFVPKKVLFTDGSMKTYE